MQGRYQNRMEAGKILAQHLSAYKNRNDVIILALPRGGVPVAAEVAITLHAPLDVFIVRKLGVPGHKELAMGAIAIGGAKIFNDEIIKEMRVTPDEIEAVIKHETAELKRRETKYRGNRTFPSLRDKTVILVDDGIATGATMKAAIMAIRQLQPTKIVIAVPVAEKAMCDRMAALVDTLICPMRPVDFFAVGAWYDDFSQTEDDEVHTLLRETRKAQTNL